MAEKLVMTALSPTMERGTITQWLKEEGDSVDSGDVLCEVETDKAAMDYEADFSSVLLKIIVQEGQSAAVGEAIAIYGEQGENYEDLLKENPAGAESAAEPAAATVEEITAAETAAAEPAATSRASENAGIPQPGSSGQRIKSSPLARRMAEDKGITLQGVSGSGYDGRIIKRDILKISEAGAASIAASSSPETIAVSGMRKTIAQRLADSKFSAPHYYLTISADMSQLIKAREEYYIRSGVKLSFNSYLIKLSASALKKHPVVNSSWSDDGISRFNSADIGFAVALDDGLIAPVIRNCEAMGIFNIDEVLKTLASKAKKNELQPQEYSGAGFSISNLGNFGIEEFTAIINPPGAAILAVGAIIKTPVVVENADADSVVIKPVMKMTLSCDHRVIDGAVGAAFLADLKRMIENPIEAMM